MQVRNAMGGSVDTCSPEDNLVDTARRMKELGHGALAVTVSGDLVGIITERDLLRAITDRLDSDRAQVGELMTPNPDSLDPEVDVRDAADKMLAAGYRHLPVVAKGKLLGMVSIKDILWAMTVKDILWGLDR